MHILGLSWLTNTAYGCIGNDMSHLCTDSTACYSQLKELRIIKESIKNFGRFDALSQKTCITVALALHDAGIAYVQAEKQDMAIIGVSDEGALESNLRYYRDYVVSGRKLARGNYFAYTLPTSSLAEASIAFGLSGAVISVMPLSTETMNNAVTTNVNNSTSKKAVVVMYDTTAMISVILSDATDVSTRTIIDLNTLYTHIHESDTVSNVIDSINNSAG